MNSFILFRFCYASTFHLSRGFVVVTSESPFVTGSTQSDCNLTGLRLFSTIAPPLPRLATISSPPRFVVIIHSFHFNSATLPLRSRAATTVENLESSGSDFAPPPGSIGSHRRLPTSVYLRSTHCSDHLNYFRELRLLGSVVYGASPAPQATTTSLHTVVAFFTLRLEMAITISGEPFASGPRLLHGPVKSLVRIQHQCHIFFNFVSKLATFRFRTNRSLEDMLSNVKVSVVTGLGDGSLLRRSLSVRRGGPCFIVGFWTTDSVIFWGIPHRCSISQSLSSWNLGALQPCVSGVPLLTKASDLYRELFQTSSLPSAITLSTLSKLYIIDLPWESEAALIPLRMLSISGGFTGVLFMRIVLHSAWVKSSPMGSSGLVLSRASSSLEEKLLSPYSSPMERDVFSDLLPSVCFSVFIGLYSCVAVSTGPEDAIEINSVFFVDEVWTSTSHYVTIVHLSDFVVKTPLTYSSTVLNSLSSSIEDLSYLVYLSVVVYVYCQRGWIIPSDDCITED